jgi:hypothetical protein
MKRTRVVLVAVLLGSAGCASLQRVADPAKFISEAKPELVYVSYRNRAFLPIAQPHVRGDSLHGTLQGLTYQIAVPLSHVERIDAVQRDNKRTTLLIASMGVVSAAGVYVLTQRSRGRGQSCDLGDLADPVPDWCS